ncbi:MAG: CehA/McbA family metallohydrolase [Acidobacteria bacterium]|nr:CehA/McbA family metallohydrolase [Acidobacteriota bacterium]MCI0720952.1 CehA/McbA family metallohydrolase [Acidobacteriota bacterium]
MRIPKGQSRQVEVRLKRWVHLQKLGWYSGDHHIHAAGCSHYESPEEGVSPEHMWREAVGEDLNVACVLSWGPCWYHQKTFFKGRVHPLSNERHVMRYDVEVSGFPSSHAGHLCLLRLQEDDYPGTQKIEEWPSWTLPVLKWARVQGGVVGYAHSGAGLEPTEPTDALPNYVLPKFDGIGANEYVVTVTHDAVDFYSAGDTLLRGELNMWYHTLNTGFRVRTSGETDSPCVFDDRVGMARTYGQLRGKLDFDRFVDAIREGRSYVSDGRSHLIDFKVNGLELGTQQSEVKPRLPTTKPGRSTIRSFMKAPWNELVSDSALYVTVLQRADSLHRR